MDKREVRRYWTVKDYLRPHFVSRDQPQVVLASDHDACVAALEAELAAVRLDAERYRWLMKHKPRAMSAITLGTPVDATTIAPSGESATESKR